MRAGRTIRYAVAWALVATAIVVAIGGAPSDNSQQRFVECIEETRHSHPEAKFDEINAYCAGNRGPLE